MNETFSIKKEKSLDERIDELEAVLLQEEEECEVHHEFTPGIYTREIGMLAGRAVVSKIHKTEHQYFVMRGVAMVRINDGDWEFIAAPYRGVTQPGTRRVLVILQDCSWVTVLPTVKTTVEEVEADIIEPHINSVLGDEINNIRQLKIEKSWLGQQ